MQDLDTYPELPDCLRRGKQMTETNLPDAKNLLTRALRLRAELREAVKPYVADMRVVMGEVKIAGLNRAGFAKALAALDARQKARERGQLEMFDGTLDFSKSYLEAYAQDLTESKRS